MERSLLQRINAFLKETNMPPTVFGRGAVQDPSFVKDLRGGRMPGQRIVGRAEHFMNKWRADSRDGRVKTSGDRRTRAAREADTGGTR